jgi:AcrR family transcriptional regulator
VATKSVGEVEPSTDPRIQRSRAAVIDATRELLREHGFAGVTIEAVSALSGVAKTTIYRHWPDREHLLLDSCVAAKGIVGVYDTGDLRGDLVAGLRMLAAELTGGDMSSLIPAMIEASERSAEFRALNEAFMAAKRAPLKDRLRIAAKRGEIRPGIDLETLMSLIAGPMFYRRLLVRQPLSKTFVDDLVDLVLGGASSTS